MKSETSDKAPGMTSEDSHSRAERGKHSSAAGGDKSVTTDSFGEAYPNQPLN